MAVKIILLILAAVVVGASVAAVGFTFVFAHGTSYLSNDPAACANCHIMTEQFDAWSRGSHHAVAVCNDCHAPHDLIGKYTTKAINGWNHSKAFTLQARGRAVTFVNDLEKTYWSGDLEVLSRLMRLPVAGLEARDLGMLLIGLPAGTESIFDMQGDADSGLLQVEHGPFRYSVAGAGFVETVAVQGDDRIVFRYAPARYPAAAVTILSTTLVNGTGKLTEHLSVTHNEVVKAPEILEEPKIQTGYQPGQPPAVLPTEE